jgi:hypothetical protein
MAAMAKNKVERKWRNKRNENNEKAHEIMA